MKFIIAIAAALALLCPTAAPAAQDTIGGQVTCNSTWQQIGQNNYFVSSAFGGQVTFLWLLPYPSKSNIVRAINPASGAELGRINYAANTGPLSTVFFGAPGTAFRMQCWSGEGFANGHKGIVYY